MVCKSNKNPCFPSFIFWIDTENTTLLGAKFFRRATNNWCVATSIICGSYFFLHCIIGQSSSAICVYIFVRLYIFSAKPHQFKSSFIIMYSIRFWHNTFTPHAFRLLGILLRLYLFGKTGCFRVSWEIAPVSFGSAGVFKDEVATV